MSVTQKLIKGAFWNAFGQFGSQIVNFIVILILARLLEPSDFGLAGMVTVFTAFLGYFSECGLTPSLVQQKEVDHLDYDTVFWSTSFFAVAIYGLVFFTAPIMANFYQNDRLVPLIRALFISFLFAPFGFVPDTIEKKSLHYRKIALADLISLIVSGSVAISLAFLKFGVWSLVWLEVARVFCRSLSLMALTRWHPGVCFSFVRLGQLMKEGAHFTLSNLVSYLANNTDYLIVGKFLGASALGIYTIAFRISRYPFMKLWAIFGQMLFPAFVNFREDPEKVKKNFLKVSIFGGIALIPFAFFLFFSMESLAALLFGMKWIGIVPVVRVLVIYLAFDSVSMSDYSLMMAYGLIKIVNLVRICSVACLAIFGFFAAIKFGLIGVATVFTVVAFVDSLVVRSLVLRQLKTTWFWTLRGLKPVWFLTMVLMLANLASFALLYNHLPGLVFLVITALINGIVPIIFLIFWGAINVKKMKFDLDVLLHAR